MKKRKRYTKERIIRIFRGILGEQTRAAIERLGSEFDRTAR